MTRNGSTLQVTNAWAYEENIDTAAELFSDIAPSSKVSDEFIITLRKGRKTTQMTFSSEHRAHILTEANKHRNKFVMDSKSKRDIPPVYRAKKWRWSEARVDVLLSVGPAGLMQMDAQTQKVLATYYYKDIKEIIQPADTPGGMAVSYGTQGRLHFFICDKKDELLAQIREKAVTNIGVVVRAKGGDTWTLKHLLPNLLGSCSSEECIISLSEFTVKKHSKRHATLVNRTLCLTEKCVVERDPASYNVASAWLFATLDARDVGARQT
ncbi:hypothetical protein SARC_05840 [Sphaeroforma arctica JP610]|uniref:DnaJ homologue subfamily C GRV2/DNAJC13 N-terminal domain-containing protein n=1 Tax=Sphaeroforma arctica JP610 TaxID=667725 RepID=A0A0L0FYE1_9EUKA|nr:hypothetical protein SARC_05840 [Sphaeroforma arctica JP610]KNC81867.1 hypothetical protein SARC_05840 [Sphaeroforma arctica JP610]|eukprot:XP_014155769.1 hypothetical protein SARC_05840 [Sphaeroforma arctica JP610]